MILGMAKMSPPKDMSNEVAIYEASMLYEKTVKEAPIDQLTPNTMIIAETKIEKHELPKGDHNFSDSGLTIILAKTENPPEA